jgi:hypothetical protein
MVSVSLWFVDLERPEPVSAWTDSMETTAGRVAEMAIEGVGVKGSDIVLTGNIVVTVRRCATDQERKNVREKYLIKR